ncbi:hypothetical protein GCM10020219_072450 [Nonomuraea dietziae]
MRLERLAGEHVVEALADLGVVVEGDDRAGLGQRLGQLVAIALGHAARGDHLGARVRRGQQRVDGVLLRRVDEAAGVDDDDVWVVVTQLPTGSVESRGELLGVDLVARAAQSDQRYGSAG